MVRKKRGPPKEKDLGVVGRALRNTRRKITEYAEHDPAPHPPFISTEYGDRILKGPKNPDMWNTTGPLMKGAGPTGTMMNTSPTGSSLSVSSLNRVMKMPFKKMRF